MLGISTTYFAAQGHGIYSAVEQAYNAGFQLAELGAAHNFEPRIPATLKKIRKDFSGMHFTLHGVFPPLKKKFWFNPAEGLSPVNKKIINGFFETADAVEAELVSFHPGFRNKALWGTEKNGLNFASYGKELKHEKAVANAFALFGLAQKLSEETGIDFAIENQPNTSGEKPLFFSKEHFVEIFARFPNCGFLFDYGHALFSSNVQEMLFLKDKIKQMHLHHSNPENPMNFKDNHNTLKTIAELQPLAEIKQLKQIPLIFEHGRNIALHDLMQEKELVESFLKVIE